MRRPIQTFFSVTLLIALLVACRERTPSTAKPSSLEKIKPIEKNDDLRALLAAEIQSGKKRIVIPPGRYRKVLPAGALHNISIVRNRIEDSAWPLIHVTSTTGLRIEENALPTTPPDPQNKAIVLEQCESR